MSGSTGLKISVVTPTLNGLRHLRETAASVLSQSSGVFQLQWIVIDGGSTDGTTDFLQSLSNSDPRIRWLSERDRGQSHALNKGLGLADGDILAWLNADDLYAPGALDLVAKTFATDDRVAWLAGRCDIVDHDGKPIRGAITHYKNLRLSRYHYRALLRENFISQPAVFWRRDLWNEVGPLDESLHWTMDYDLWLRMGNLCDPRVLPTTLAYFRVHPQSKSGKFDRRQFDEQYKVAQRYFGEDHISRWAHKLNVEKIVLSYRLMRAMR